MGQSTLTAKGIVRALASGTARAASRLRPDAASRPPWERSVLDDIAARRPWNIALKVARLRARVRLRRTSPTDGVTVVIVNWNTREVLVDVLTAVRGLSPLDTEILVVDNGSRDGSLEMLSSWPHVRQLRLPTNVGHGLALDLAICLVRTRVAVTLDSDAIPLAKDWLAPVVEPVRSGQALIAGLRSRRGFAHPAYLAVDTACFVRSNLSFQPFLAPGARSSTARWGENAWDTGELMTPRVPSDRVILIDPTPNTVDGLPGMTAAGVVYHHGGMTRAGDGGLTEEAIYGWRSACRSLGVDIGHHKP